MAVIIIIAVAVFTFIFALYVLSKDRLPQNLPPGPSGLPVVGNLHQLNSKCPWKTVTNWGKTYGSVYKLYFGRQLVIVLNDCEAVKEAFVRQGDNFSARPHIWIAESFIGGKFGILIADGERWKEQRRFALQVLKDFGLGRSIMEEKIKLEVETMISELNKRIMTGTQQPIDVVKEVNYTVTNIIFAILFGWTYKRGDQEFEQFTLIVDDVLKTMGLAGLLEFFPFLRHIVPGGLGYSKLIKYNTILRDGCYRREMKKGRERFKQGIVSDFVAVYWQEIVKRRDEKENASEHYFNEQQLENIIGDFFFAGQETTVVTTQWGLLHLMYHPEIQDKIYCEIHKNVGHYPSWSDRSSLPYTSAAILEILRLGNIVPFGVLHATYEDAFLNGYFIPKGTTILPNLWAIHMDERYYPNPENFDPGRFLNEDGTLNQKADSFMPFSIGKRMCLGESLARMELFLILTALVWNYRFEMPKGKPPPSRQPLVGFTLTPEHFLIQLTQRM